MASGLKIVRRAHRSLVALLACVTAVVRDGKTESCPPDLALLGATVWYLQDCPSRFHHPRESRHLIFRLAAAP